MELEVIWNRPPKLKGERPPMDLERLAELWYGTPSERLIHEGKGEA